MKFNILILVGFLISTGILRAQTDFKPGYIIKNTGDTIFGEIDYRGDILMGTICKFKNSDNSIVEYSPSDILGYRFIDSKYYVSKEVDSKKVFLEYLIKGKISIYYIRDKNGEHYYLDKEDVNLTEIPYEEGIKYKNDKQYYYSSTKHFGVLNYYMQDAPGIKKKIQKIRTPQNHNLIKLAEDYNDIVCDGEKCIIYEKKQPLLKINPEIIGGVINFKNLKGKYFINSGVIINLWLPRFNEKIYLRTGLLYSNIESDNGTQSIFKIPLQIEYVYPESVIRPKLSIGFNLFNPFYQSVGLMGGLNIRLHKVAYLSINCDIDFTPSEKFAFIPDSRFSYSLLTGLYMTF